MTLLFLAPVVFIIPVSAVDVVAITLVIIDVAVILDSFVTVFVAIIGAGSIVVGGFVSVFF